MSLRSIIVFMLFNKHKQKMDIINLRQEEFIEKQCTNLNIILKPDPSEVGEHINKLQKKCGEIYICEKDVFNILCIFCETSFEEAQKFFTHVKCDHEEGQIAELNENDPLEIRSDNGNQEEVEPTINEKIKCENVVFPENSALDESKTQNSVENILIGDNFENELETRKDYEVKNKNTEFYNVGYKTFNSKRALQRHNVRKHPKKKTKSKTQSQVETDEKNDGEQSKEDEKSLESETDDPLKCKYCGRRLAHKSSLKEHMRIHTGEKPYQCQICAIQFRTASCVRRHKKTHSDIRQFKCENMFIGDNFENELKTRKDPEVKNKNTEFCYKTFNSKRTLQRHKGHEHQKKKTKSKTQSQVETDEKNDGEQSKEDEKSLESETDDPLKYKYCGRRLADNFTLKEHVRIHTGEKPYQCQICAKQFRTASCVRRHEKTHSDIRQFKCENMFIGDNLENELETRKDPEVKNKNTEFCYKTFNSNRTLQRHKRREHPKKKTKSKTQSQVETDEKNVGEQSKEDEKSLESEIDDPLKCKYCGRRLANNFTLKEHVRIHTGERPYQCQICGKQFRTSCCLGNHEKLHNDIRQYKCEKCGMAFKSKMNLKNHSLRHGVKKIKCNFCDQLFHTKFDRVDHERVHTGEKPFKCNFCGKCFQTSSSLNRHTKMHTGIRPHKCQYCDRSFAVKAGLNYHVLIHTGERPFVCTTCSATFSRKEYLKIHEKIHSDYRRHVCKICEKAYKQYASLYAHMKKHNIKVTD